MAKVALVVSPIHVEMLKLEPIDRIAELDSAATIRAVEDALREGGHEVVQIESDEAVYENLRRSKPEIVFNLAEGIRGESRESHIPAMCEFLGIPYTGSGVLTTAVCLDKVMTKRVLESYGLPTARYQVFADANVRLDPRLRFPLIAKLAHEGSSMGLSSNSVVDNEATLRQRVQRLVDTYRQPVLVEEFIQGREFTVGILGNAELEVLPTIEVKFDDPRGINLFQIDDPVLKMAADNGFKLQQTNPDTHHVFCPADVGPALQERINRTAQGAYRALECRDWCRIDMRYGQDGQLYILELNPIAGIDPSFHLPRAARVAGYTYAALINRILDLAFQRAKR